jgi:hypothetical protein
MNKGLPVFLPLVIGLFSIPVSAQTKLQDSLIFQAALSNTLAVYYSQLGDQSPLYNGSLYTPTGFTFRTGTPYFPSEQFDTGSVIYDGITFGHLPLLYDDLRQLLITKNDNYLLQLVNPRIRSFSIRGHSFIRLVADSLNPGISRTGFFEVLYPGPSKVLKETFKTIVEQPSIEENAIIRFIEESHDYFIRSGNTYRRVKSTGELTDILHDHQKEIRRFMKKNKLNFRRDKENTLIQVAGYYDQIAK